MLDTGPDIRISEATREDISLLMIFIRELADYERLSEEVVATEADLRRSLFTGKPRAEAFIAWVDDVPAGFALVFYNFSTFVGRPGLYLEDLFVRPSYRRRGVGRRLLAHVAGLAVARGCGRLEWSVLDWNEMALGLYRKVGAVPMAEWTVHRLTGDALDALASEMNGP